MPIPQPRPNEDKNTFIQRCMSNPTMVKEYPDIKQRSAICFNQTKGVLELMSENLEEKTKNNEGQN